MIQVQSITLVTYSMKISRGISFKFDKDENM